ncbi:MAG: hypothetical protein NVS2B17_28520 [Candidatus Velthaea sp.]
MNDRVTLARDFERESHRIDQYIWDAMALRAGETVLFCGFHNDLDWIARAIGVGVRLNEKTCCTTSALTIESSFFQ